MNKKDLISSLKIDTFRKKGQKVSEAETAVRIVCEELNIDISVGTHRSLLQNKELTMVLMEAAIEKVLKYETL